LKDFIPLFVKALSTSLRWLALGLLAAGTLTTCTLRDQVSETPTGPTLKFRLARIDEASLGGLDAKPWREPADVNLAQRSQLIQGYVNGDLPLRMALQLEVRDPSLSGQTLSALDYEVFIDDKLLGSGRTTPSAALPTDGSAVLVPLSFNLNTVKLLGKDALPALRNFAVGLADRRRRPMRLGLRLRPTTISAGGQASVLKNFLLVDTDSAAMVN
jgi:hypothetical protein